MELESVVGAFLHNAAARSLAAERAAPASPSVDYRTGFSAGKEAGELGALALILAELTGASVESIIEEARAGAAVEAALPFDLRVEILEGPVGKPRLESRQLDHSDVLDAPPDEAEFVPCPRCWLPAEVLRPVPGDEHHRSLCPRGHENTLVPAVLAHLRSLMSERDESAS
ncbi:MAG: hypothetical protein ACRD0N_14650 [Acidimicrobiales bacterium]